jgi:hypothetical protein
MIQNIAKIISIIKLQWLCGNCFLVFLLFMVIYELNVTVVSLNLKTTIDIDILSFYPEITRLLFSVVIMVTLEKVGTW